jgi:hypothetical protein
MRSLRWIPCFVALAVVATACGGGSKPAAKHKPAPSTTTTTAGPPVSPLTGLPDPTGQSATRPALSIKIENTPEARPQTGLDMADVVYEEITEAGITRFLAIYNSTVPPVVGPVRSARIMDPDLFTPLGGIFVYSGAIQATISALNAAPGVNVIVDTGESSTGLFRDPTKIAPHNLYGHTAQLFAKGGKPTPPPALFQYLPTGVPFTGAPVTQFTVRYESIYAPTYTWDPPSGTWKRSIQGAPFMDTDGNQVAPQNVIVQFVGCCLSSPEGANYITTGNGDAWVFSNGSLVQGKWSRTSTSQVIQYTDASGQPIRLTPGRTWVELMPEIGFDNALVLVTPPSSGLPIPTTTTTTLPPKTKSTKH